ncbi:MAG: hypothetical protein HYX43_15940 [Burkholderiales bacterium]|nr:hypothetical protein [Burkholderiales bacterium]
MSLLKRLFTALFNITIGPVLALILIFEEWGWEPLSRLLGYLARLPLWARVEAFITRLPPYGALVAFFVPALMLLPVKLLALYWISRGHAVLGLVVVLAAKVAGTAAVARLFALTQPALMRLAWFAHWYGRWVPWKNALIARVKNTPIWRSTAATVRSIRRWIGF